MYEKIYTSQFLWIATIPCLILSFSPCRPTLWTTNNLNVLETEDVTRNNDRFIMAAANGDIGEWFL